MISSARLLVAAFVCCALPSGAFSQAAEPEVDLQALDQAVFLFGGRLHDGNIGDNFLPVRVDFEDNYILGGGYNRVFWSQPDGFSLGIEAGFAARFGEGFSAELWYGPFLRYDGWVLADTFRISPSLIFGLSIVTDTIGSETDRAATISSTDGRMLFYLTPEVSIASVDNPEFEIFWRGQHRSSGYGLLGYMHGANAVTFGVRHRF